MLDGGDKKTDDAPGGASPALWLIGPLEITSRLDSADLGPNTGGISGAELRPGDDTGHGQQDAGSGERQLLFPFSYTQVTKETEKRLETAPLSTVANHTKKPSDTECERGPRGQRQKSGRGSGARRLEELQQCATLRITCPLVPGYVQDSSRTSPALERDLERLWKRL